MTETVTRAGGAPMDLLGAYGQAVHDADVNDFDPHFDRISFLYGLPDPDHLPAVEVAEAVQRALASEGKVALQYGRVGGYPPLVDYLRAFLKRMQMMDVPEDAILLTAGSTQALGFVTQLLVDRGDVIVTEDPTWPGGVSLFNAAGARIVTVPLDRDGMRMDALEERLRALRAEGVRPKFIYTIPNFQNPVGVTLTMERRRTLLDLAAEYDTFVFEDDAYNALRFEGEILPALYALDAERGGNRVITIGTLSKTLAAGMRLGWVIAPPALIRKIGGIKGDGGVSPFSATAAAEFCLAGKLEPHIETLKTLYRGRRDAMVAALSEYMPEGVTWTEPHGGFFMWVTVPQGINTAKLLPVAMREGFDFLPGVACRFDGGGANEIRLSFSVVGEEQIREGIARLGRLIHRAMAEQI